LSLRKAGLTGKERDSHDFKQFVKLLVARSCFFRRLCVSCRSESEMRMTPANEEQKCSKPVWNHHWHSFLLEPERVRWYVGRFAEVPQGKKRHLSMGALGSYTSIKFESFLCRRDGSGQKWFVPFWCDPARKRSWSSKSGEWKFDPLWLRAFLEKSNRFSL